MEYFVVVNEYEKIPLFSWSASEFNSTETLRLATDDLVYVKTVFQTIENIKIVDVDNAPLGEFLCYDTYENISYEGRAWSSDLDKFTELLSVKLRKVSITEDVERIDKKVNNIVDIDAMDVEVYKEYLISIFSDMGQETIFRGTNVTLSDGSTKMFTYNFEDQCNLLNALVTIQALDDLTIHLPYHSHGEPCSLYTAIDIARVYFTLQFYSTTVQTRVNMLCAWVRATNTKEELLEIHFDSDLPEYYQQKINEIMGPTYELARRLEERYFPAVNGAGAIEDGDNDNENEEEEIENEVIE